MRGLSLLWALAPLYDTGGIVNVNAQLTALGRYVNANCSAPPYLVLYTKLEACVKTECDEGALSSCINSSALEDAKSVFEDAPYLVVDKYASEKCAGEPQSTLALVASGKCLAMNHDNYVKASITDGKVTYGSYSDANCTSGSPLEGQEPGKCVISFKFTIGGSKSSTPTTGGSSTGSSSKSHDGGKSTSSNKSSTPGVNLSRSVVGFASLAALWVVPTRLC